MRVAGKYEGSPGRIWGLKLSGMPSGTLLLLGPGCPWQPEGVPAASLHQLTREQKYTKKGTHLHGVELIAPDRPCNLRSSLQHPLLKAHPLELSNPKIWA